MPQTRFGGVVLCGGHSTRMGRPKATLPFGSELMLPRVVRLLGEVVQPIVVVAAAAGQTLPPLPTDVLIARDAHADRGPLQGLLAGFTALVPYVDAAFASSCDVPLLKPAFVRRMIELLGDDEIVVAKEHPFHHPLAAVYRTSVVDRIDQLLRSDRLRPIFLFELARTREVSVEELRGVDPDLHSLWNLNHPADYFAALAVAGFPADPEQTAKERS